MNSTASEKRPFWSLSRTELANSLTAGLIGGIMIIMVAISFAAFVFTADLAVFLPQGIGLFLVGAALLAILTAVFGKTPGIVTAIQDAPITILAAMLANISQNAAALPREARFLTLLAAISLATVLAGSFFYLLGHFKLGRLIRYVPYPIIGGFLTGTGWLVFIGSLEIMTDQALGWQTLGSYFTPDLMLRWLPGVTLGLTIWLILRRYAHYLILPGLLLGSAVLFYLTLLIMGLPISTALDQGWLIGPFPAGSMWQPYLLTGIGQVNIGLILAEAKNFTIIILLATIAFLLNTTGTELILKQDIDFNQELRSVGLFNIIIGLSGSAIGFVTTGFTSLAYRLGGNNRATTLIVGLLAALVTVVGASLLELIPKFIIGGLIFFIGLSFMAEWLYDGRSQISRLEYGLILLITVVIGSVGFLEGVLVGLIAAVILFVLEYSRVDVLRAAFSGNNYRSTVWRPRLHQQLLAQKGHWIHIIKLQGYIFFGTADSLLNQIQAILSDEAKHSLRFILLDFELVTGLDASASHSLLKAKQSIVDHDRVLLFTNLATPIHHRLTETGVTADNHLLFFDSLKQGVAWCEEQMLATFASTGLGLRTRTLRQQLEALVAQPRADENLLDFLQGADGGDRLAKVRSLLAKEETNGRFDPYLDKQQLPANTILIQQGATQQGIYFLETGQAHISHSHTSQPDIVEAGSVIGKTSLYNRQAVAPATITTSQPSLVYHLSHDKLVKMEAEAPALAAVFHRFMASLMNERLEQLTAMSDHTHEI